MAWHDADGWLTAALSPTPTAILLTFAVAILLPILVHTLLYRSAAKSAQTSSILLLGPSGSGKTSLCTLLNTSTVTSTHTSTAPSTTLSQLPSPYIPASAQYRSPGDPAFERARAFNILDTPGHGKLRRFAHEQLSSPADISGIVFVVDAAALSEEAGLEDASAYLHDVLLALQKRYTSATTSKGPAGIPVLVAANKSDLFTALPERLIRVQLEKGISDVRVRRAKAVRDAGRTLDGQDEVEEEGEWLGEGGEGAFTFEQMREIGMEVEVKAGNVSVGGKGVGDVEGWWKWIAERL